MKRLILLLFGLCLLALGGCATQDNSSSPRVNTMPWNRPESHEGMGQLGFLNTR